MGQRVCFLSSCLHVGSNEVCPGRLETPLVHEVPVPSSSWMSWSQKGNESTLPALSEQFGPGTGFGTVDLNQLGCHCALLVMEVGWNAIPRAPV